MKALEARPQSSAASSLAGVSAPQRILYEQVANLLNIPPVYRN